MGRQQFFGILLVMIVYCCCFFSAVSVWGETSDSLYDQVLKKLNDLTPSESLVVDMGVEEERYQEHFKVDSGTIVDLQEAGIPNDVLAQLEGLKEEEFANREEFTSILEEILGKQQAAQYALQILNAAYEGQAVYQYGDRFEMRFQASKESYFAIMHIAERKEDPALKTFVGGEITFLLPNRKFSETRIEANTAYSTVQDFNIHIPAGPPPAMETINLFCTTQKLDWIESMGGDSPYYVITPDDEQKLQKLLDDLETLEAMEWSGSSLKLQIGPLTRGVKKFGALPPIGATGTTGKFFPPIGATGTTGKTDTSDMP